MPITPTVPPTNAAEKASTISLVACSEVEEEEDEEEEDGGNDKFSYEPFRLNTSLRSALQILEYFGDSNLKV